MKPTALILLSALLLASATPASAEGLGLLGVGGAAPAPSPSQQLYWKYNTLKAKIRTWEGILNGDTYLLGRDPGQKANAAELAVAVRQEFQKRGIRPSSAQMRQAIARIRTISNGNKAWVRSTELPRLRRELAAVSRRLGVAVR